MKRAIVVLMVALAVLTAPFLGAQATYNDARTVPFTCRIAGATSTTECQALTAGRKAYVTLAVLSNNFAAGQTLKLVTGMGTDCGTGTADLTHAFQFAAVGNQVLIFRTPLQPSAAGLAICVTPSAATSYSA